LAARLARRRNTHVGDASIRNIRDEPKNEEHIALDVGDKVTDVVPFDFTVLDAGLILCDSSDQE
jgi:hypothetical protein